jgi:predicted ATPase/class 3 adenylate cyclase
MHPLAAYIPIDRLHAMAQGTTLSGRMHGAAMFADISGFTSLAQALAERLGSRQGAEELTQLLNQVYETLIDWVYSYHGSVIGFVGDAITCWFDADDGLRATTCALAMQEAMRPFAQIHAIDAVTATFSIKIGIAAGTALRLQVGDPEIQCIDVLAGSPLRRMSLAEGTARKGEILLDADTAIDLEDALTITEWRPHPQHGGRYAVIAAITKPMAPSPWPSIPDAFLDDTQLRPWVLPSVYERVKTEEGEFLADLRPAVSLFLKFGDLDYDNDPNAGEKLDAYIRWVQKMVSRYAGNLIQLTVGDKGSFLYTAFGAPVAHDDDAVHAVQVGLELLNTPPALAYITSTQIGIAQGQARTGAYGSSTRRSYGVIGDDAVLAARLMAVAPPGEIRCSYSIYHQTGGRIAFDVLPPVLVKGRVEPQRVYRPTRIENVLSRDGASKKIVIGRRAEIARLTVMLDAVLAGESRILFIEGEAGIGKSYMVSTLIDRIRERVHTCLFGSGQSMEQNTPYRAWRDILNGYFDIHSADDMVARCERITAFVRQNVPDEEQCLPLLNDVLNLDLPESAVTSSLDPQLRQLNLRRLVLELLLAWARERPLFLILEDAHWMDVLSWQLTEYVIQSLSETQLPLWLIVVSRPMDARSTSGTLAGSRIDTLSLTTLDPADTIALVTARLGLPAGGLPAPVARLVRERAEGNPFFAEELVFALRDRGLIKLETAADQVRCTISHDWAQASQTLPDTVHGLVLVRIDQLSSEQQLTLKVAAVLGRIFGYAMLRNVIKQHTAISDAALKSHLVTLEILDLTPLETADPLTYIFKHIVTQEAAYHTLLFAQRRTLHRTVAETLERLFQERVDEQVELLAYHWERSAEPKKAVPYLVRAGQRARLAYANDDAITRFRQALTLLGSETTSEAQSLRFAAWQGLGRTYFAMPNMAQAEVCLREAIKLGQTLDIDTAELARLYHWLGETLWWQNRTDDQIDVGLRALALLGKDALPSEALALANQTVAVGYIGKDDLEQFFAYTFRTASFIEQLPYSEELRPAFVHIVVACQQKGDIDGTLKWLRALEERAASHGDLRAVAEVHYLTGETFAGLGDLRQAILHYEKGLELYERIGETKFQVWCLKGLGIVHRTLGHLQEAATCAARALELSIAAGDNRHMIGESYLQMGIDVLCQGNLAGAEDAFDTALRIFREVKSYPAQLMALLHRGHLALRAGKRKVALARFQKAMPHTQPELHIAHVVSVLAGLERTYAFPQAFRTFCHRYRAKLPEVNTTSFGQWFLEAAQPDIDCGLPIVDCRFTEEASQDQAWAWEDPLGDCSFAMRDGLVIHAANGRDLWKANQSAPRLVRPVSGDVIVQTTCETVFPVKERPTIGGLVLWKDGANFLRVDRGRFGPDDILFSGNLNGQPDLFGRGRLPLDGTGRVYLRLERIGGCAHALCSADGVQWFTVGHINFPVVAPVQVGVFAIGNIDRLIYPPAYPEGTAIRFTSFQFWATM